MTAVGLEGVVSGRLVGLLRTLTDLPEGDVVARAVAEGLFTAPQVGAVAIFASSRTGTQLQLVGSHGLDPDLAHLYSLLPVEVALPACEAYRAGQDLVMRVAEIEALYPAASQEVATAPEADLAETAYLVLRRGGVPRGVMLIRFDRAPDWTWQARDHLDGAASSVSMWLAARQGTDRGVDADREIFVTDRQRQVLQLLRRGDHIRDVAEQLGYSEGTIRADIGSLYRLLGAASRPELLQRAEQAGL